MCEGKQLSTLQKGGTKGKKTSNIYIPTCIASRVSLCTLLTASYSALYYDIDPILFLKGHVFW